MAYAHRTIHDADGHIMELPEWLYEHADPKTRARLSPINVTTVADGDADRIAQFRADHADPEYRAQDEEQLLLRKNWAATGSFIKEDRPAALDLLGFESQLLFNTFTNGKLLSAERDDDPEFGYGFARAHNLSMAEFCSVDPRLLASGYVPLRDFGRSRAHAAETIEMGCNALLVPSGSPASSAMAQTGSSPIWLGECPRGQPEGTKSALQPISMVSAACARLRSKSRRGT